ncbi:EamA family transporter [Bacillus sp. DJP31]|uniref:EamA family transporter n=1 Tax=Bacillus sp. DJP31 TaxID=3409789 RepID=UPI003BB725CB
MQPSVAIQPNQRVHGVALVLMAATLWGVSGTIAQYLFQEKAFNAGWLVVVRLLAAGLLMLLLSYPKNKDKIWSVWRNKKDRIQIIIFSLFGMLAVQYTYFEAIELSNAATATVLQYLGPVLILGFMVIKSKRLPTYNELLVIFLAVVGTFLLVTNGSLGSLSISGWGLFWGISSAFALAFYTLYPSQLIQKWGTMVVVGWAMFIGGVSLSFVHAPWDIQASWGLTSVMAIIFIIILGTLIPFYCFLESMRYISASEASTLSCTEPLSAAIISVVWLHVSFGVVQWIGTIFIVSTIFLISRWKSN